MKDFVACFTEVFDEEKGEYVPGPSIRTLLEENNKMWEEILVEWEDRCNECMCYPDYHKLPDILFEHGFLFVMDENGNQYIEYEPKNLANLKNPELWKKQIDALARKLLCKIVDPNYREFLSKAFVKDKTLQWEFQKKIIDEWSELRRDIQYHFWTKVFPDLREISEKKIFEVVKGLSNELLESGKYPYLVGPMSDEFLLDIVFTIRDDTGLPLVFVNPKDLFSK